MLPEAVTLAAAHPRRFAAEDVANPTFHNPFHVALALSLALPYALRPLALPDQMPVAGL